MAVAELGGLSGPVDREVDLADLGERFGGVLEPGRHPAVAGVSADDGLDVVVEYRQPLRVPVEGEPLVGMGPPQLPVLAGVRAEAGFEFGQSSAVAGDAEFAECGRVGDRIEGEVVDVAVRAGGGRRRR